MKIFSHLVIVASLGCLLSCQQDSPTTDLPLFEWISPTQSGIIFKNNLKESPTRNVLNYEYYYNGAGLAIGDVNGDELPDIYMVSNFEPNHLD
ncbi:MAG: hypothetical protein AAFY71_22060 [Bacteroidota bacterium]